MLISSMQVWEKSGQVTWSGCSTGFHRTSPRSQKEQEKSKEGRVHTGELNLKRLLTAYVHCYSIHTFFSQKEIQEVVGVRHTHFSLHLRPPESGVDIARASSLFCLTQLREPTPHVSVRKKEKTLIKTMGDLKKEKKTEEQCFLSIHSLI